jgi:hypothetical protein
LSKITFNMNPGQLALWENRDPNVLFCGGFGSGKTTGGAFKFLQMKAANPTVPALIISQTSKSLWGTTVRRLLTTCIEHNIPVPKIVDRQYECYLDFGDGVPIFLRGAHSPSSYDGLDVGYMWGDEIRHWQKTAYDIALGRRRVPCKQPQSVFTSTPDMHWMGLEYDSGKLDRPVIRAPTRENLHNLSPEFIENLKSSYSPRMQDAVLEGIFCVLTGAVFEEFSPKPDGPWFVDFDPTTKHGKQILNSHKVYLAIDPGYRKSAWLWVLEYPNHESDIPDWVVFDQYMPDDESDSVSVHEVNRRGWPIDEIWYDPAAGAVQSLDGRTVKDALAMIKPREYNTHPLRNVGKYRSIQFGIDKLRTLLGGYDGKPVKIKFARRLLEMERGRPRGIVKDLAALRYPEVKDGRAISDTPLKDGLTDHSTDGLRYLAVGLWRSIPRLKKLLDLFEGS